MKKLEDVEVPNRQKAVFECDVSDPEAEVQWFKEDKVGQGYVECKCMCPCSQIAVDLYSLLFRCCSTLLYIF